MKRRVSMKSLPSNRALLGDTAALWSTVESHWKYVTINLKMRPFYTATYFFQSHLSLCSGIDTVGTELNLNEFKAFAKQIMKGVQVIYKEILKDGLCNKQNEEGCVDAWEKSWTIK